MLLELIQRVIASILEDFYQLVNKTCALVQKAHLRVLEGFSVYQFYCQVLILFGLILTGLSS